MSDGFKKKKFGWGLVGEVSSIQVFWDFFNFAKPLMRTLIYWLSVPAITDRVNKCCVFGGHFNPKSLAAHTLSCHRLFMQFSMLPSGDCKQYFISRVNQCY